MSGSWDDEADTTSDLHKAVIPILTNALNYDIQEAANKATAAIQSGVSECALWNSFLFCL